MDNDGHNGIPVAVIGPNPAWQRTLTFNRLSPGCVNRALEVCFSAAGKGINLARSAKTLGLRPSVIQLAGGATGKALIDSLNAEDISHATVETASPTRECITCLSLDGTAGATELIGPPASITPDENFEFRKVVTHSIINAKGIALCGSLPKGVGSELYADVASTRPSESILLVDAWKDIDPLLESGIDALKINFDEIALMFPGLSSPMKAAEKCVATKRVRSVALTAGASHAFIFTQDFGAWKYSIPKLDKIVNPIGAGDTVAGALMAGLLSGMPPHLAFRSALAAGTASCVTKLPACFELDFYHSLINCIEIAQL